MGSRPSETDVRTRRGRTAIRRVACSRPVALALGDGIIGRETTVFDYGCGWGADARYLKSRGIRAAGWDPHHLPGAPVIAADVVNLGYVLNVIEQPSERVETLRKAFALAESVLVVAVRVDGELAQPSEFGDGVLTGIGTFQKFYSQSEFRALVEATLGRRLHTVALGIGYVFKDELAEARYIANRAFTRRLEYRTDLISEFSANATAKRYISLCNKLGRLALPAEFKSYPKLLELFGSSQRIERLALHHIDRAAFAGSREQRREDILTFLAMMRFQRLKPPPLAALPETVRADIRANWTGLTDAVTEAERFLFSIGRPEVVAAACRGSVVGKLLPEDLYVHRSAEDELPALVRLIIFGARQVVGDVDSNLIKVRLDGRAVSFLSYPDFDEDPHPALARSIRVYLPKAEYSARSYENSDNPPILHRKETFVARSYRLHATFAALTAAEEAAGLLGGNDIGFARQWEALLEQRGLTVSGHKLVPLISA